MENENNIEGVSNNNTKVVFLVSFIFIIIATISVYSFFKIKNSKLLGSDDKAKVLENNQAEINRMSAELDAIRAGRATSTQASLKEQVKSMDALRNRAIKKQPSSITTEEQQKELEKLKSNTTAN